MNSPWRRTGLTLGYSILALVIIGLVSIIWGGLIFANLKIWSRVPWCLAAIIVILRLLWLYLSGRGWPSSTSERRKKLLRANLVSRNRFIWSCVAGVVAIVALAGYWIVAFHLFRMSPNLVLPQRFTSSNVLLIAFVIGASLVAPITEESSVRGYLQSVLEREFSPFAAITISSIVFALAHVSQGIALPKLFVYFLVGVAFGSLAFVNDSILPVIPVHILGDLIFFIFIWPNDGTRQSVWTHPGDLWFWVHAVQAIAFTALFILVFRHLMKLQKLESTSTFTTGHDKLNVLEVSP